MVRHYNGYAGNGGGDTGMVFNFNDDGNNCGQRYDGFGDIYSNISE